MHAYNSPLFVAFLPVLGGFASGLGISISAWALGHRNGVRGLQGVRLISVAHLLSFLLLSSYLLLWNRYGVKNGPITDSLFYAVTVLAGFAVVVPWAAFALIVRAYKRDVAEFARLHSFDYGAIKSALLFMAAFGVAEALLVSMPGAGSPVNHLACFLIGLSVPLVSGSIAMQSWLKRNSVEIAQEV